MKRLSPEEVLYLHHRIIEETTGSHGVRDIGLFESSMERPYSGFGEYELYESLEEKAAALLDSLIRNHPFVDGNKRTAMAAAVLLLEMNGRRFSATQAEFVEFAVSVAVDHPSIQEIAKWLQTHSVPSSGDR